MMQRSLVLGVGLCLTFSFATAQKQLTNRDIWASPLFSAEYVGGLALINTPTAPARKWPPWWMAPP